MEFFVIYFTQGESWQEGKPIWEQDLDLHKEYWLKYRQEGKVLAGGPFMDHSGGIVILEVKDVEEATDLASNDPAVVEKIFNAKIHPWQPLAKNF